YQNNEMSYPSFGTTSKTINKHLVTVTPELLNMTLQQPSNMHPIVTS
ncbi:2802_t:CDS:1, partial [Dentiscutata heterogama]